MTHTLYKKFTTPLLFALAATLPAGGQDTDKAQFSPGDTAKPNLEEFDLLQSATSVIDKLIALEQDLKKKGIQIDWTDIFDKYRVDFDPDSIEEEANLCLALGFKVADGTIALKAQDAERVNECAQVIEELTKRLEIPQENLNRAYLIKNAVNRGDWFDAFLQLNMYRQEIVRELGRMDREGAEDGKAKSEKSKAILIVCGAWFQGARTVINVLESNYDKEMTNYLRSPRFVLLMDLELNRLNPALKSSDQVHYMISQMDAIYNIVNVDRDHTVPEGQISLSKLGELLDVANRLVIGTLP
jgi:hypothetical protein